MCILTTIIRHIIYNIRRAFARIFSPYWLMQKNTIPHVSLQFFLYNIMFLLLPIAFFFYISSVLLYFFVKVVQIIAIRSVGLFIQLSEVEKYIYSAIVSSVN